ncbi:Hypothetical predicted protein [Pelobates cultripes]|uniref:Uncharacterized protein n=1 Tax=Pelobates cultripes TaxID=61616 RepID=A0AAD1SH75_PELCU|nr:Hypothetical predicted protein [Pelobates cultripes]
MLRNLHSSLREVFKLITEDLRKDLHGLGAGTEALVDKTDELCVAHTEMLNRMAKMETEHLNLVGKFADMEDRLRRNNITLRGVPEYVFQEELPQHLMSLFKFLLLSVADADLLIDRTHRGPKPRGLAADIPRDIIVRLHYFHIKEAIPQAHRKAPDLLEYLRGISLIINLSATTMAKRREFVNTKKMQ